MFCTNCGKEFSKDAAYCEQCGTRISVTEEKNNSPKEDTHSIKSVLFSFVASGIVAGLFLAVAIFVIDNIPALGGEEASNASLWTIVVVFGVLTAIFPLICKGSSIVKLTSYFLGAYWILGTLLVVAIVFFLGDTSEQQEVVDTPTEEEVGFECTRDEPYEMPEEFKRALSLRKQRLQESGRGFVVETEKRYENCLNIQYGDLRLAGGAEGVFWFDDSVSTADNLQITVDNTFRFNDDLLLAILLQHELQHVIQFIRSHETEEQISCIDSETEAFTAELGFIRMLNDGELESIVTRFQRYKEKQTINEYSEDFFNGMDTMFFAAKYANAICDARVEVGTSKKEELPECRRAMEYTQIRRMLESYKYCDEG